MSKKFLHLLIFSVGTSSVFMNPDPIQSSYCAELQHECHGKCVKEIRLNDLLLKECEQACDDAKALCYKKYPDAEFLDRLEGRVSALEWEQRNIKQRDWQLRKELNNPPKQ